MALGFLAENITDFCGEIATSMVDSMMDTVMMLVTVGEDITLGNDVIELNQSCIAIQGISTLLLCCMLGKQIFTTYVTETDGDSDMDPTQLLVKFSQAMVAIWSVIPVFSILIDYSRKFTTLLLDTIDISFDNLPEAIITIINRMIDGQGTNAIFALIYVIAVIVFAVRIGIRGGELILLKVTMPLLAFDLITPSREHWNAFISSGMVTIFGYTISLFIFKTSLAFSFSSNLGDGGLLLSLSFLFLAIKTPKFLEKYAYTSGVGSFVGHTLQSALLLMRRV